MKRFAVNAALALSMLCAPAAASAHEVLFEVERARAVALRAWHADGEPLAQASFEVVAPDGKVHQSGKTDSQGYLAFVPSAPGSWRVKVADATGHGLETRIEVPAGGAAPQIPASARGPRGLYRPLVGAAVIGLLFGGLYFLLHRRPRKT